LFSTHITKRDLIDNRYLGKWNFTGSGWLRIGEEGSSDRKRAERDIALRTVSGSRKAKIIFKHNGKECKVLRGDTVDFEEGIRVNAKGVATPIVRNISARGKMISIAYVDKPLLVKYVPARSVEVVPFGLEGFVTVEVN